MFKKILFSVLFLLFSSLSFSYWDHYEDFMFKNNFKTYTTNKKIFISDRGTFDIMIFTIPQKNDKFIVGYFYGVFPINRKKDNYPMLDNLKRNEIEPYRIGIAPALNENFNYKDGYDVLTKSQLDSLLKEYNAKELSTSKYRKQLQIIKNFSAD